MVSQNLPKPLKLLFLQTTLHVYFIPSPESHDSMMIEGAAAAAAVSVGAPGMATKAPKFSTLLSS